MWFCLVQHLLLCYHVCVSSLLSPLVGPCSTHHASLCEKVTIPQGLRAQHVRTVSSPLNTENRINLTSSRARAQYFNWLRQISIYSAIELNIHHSSIAYIGVITTLKVKYFSTQWPSLLNQLTAYWLCNLLMCVHKHVYLCTCVHVWSSNHQKN